MFLIVFWLKIVSLFLVMNMLSFWRLFGCLYSSLVWAFVVSFDICFCWIWSSCLLYGLALALFKIIFVFEVYSDKANLLISSFYYITIGILFRNFHHNLQFKLNSSYFYIYCLDFLKDSTRKKYHLKYCFFSFFHDNLRKISFSFLNKIYQNCFNRPFFCDFLFNICSNVCYSN